MGHKGIRLTGPVPFSFGDNMHKTTEALGLIADNAWAFMLFLLAAVVALVAHYGGDKDLMQFATGITMTGAAVMHGKDKKD